MMMSLTSGKQTPRFCQCQRQYIVRLHAAGRMRRSADGKQNGETASVYEVAAFPSPTESASPSPPSIAAELNSMLCRLARLGLRRRRGEVDIEDHGAVLMASGVPTSHSGSRCVRRKLARRRPRARTRAQVPRFYPKPRAGRKACPAAASAECKPRPPRVPRSRLGWTPPQVDSRNGPLTGR